MQEFRQLHTLLLKQINLRVKRYALQEFPLEDRIMGITGARGVGKTWLLLQYIKQKYGLSEEALYISLDHLYFSNRNFSGMVEDFVNRGGIHIFIDEVHKHPEWNLELRKIYNQHPGLKITFAGSSLLQVPDKEKDPEQGLAVFNLPGLSFREYLNFTLKTEFEAFPLEEILEFHTPVAMAISKKIKPLKYFEEYLRHGYFPFFLSNKTQNYRNLLENINLTVEMDLPHLRGVDPSKTRKIKQLLYIITHSAPFKPNISKIASEIGITRNTLNEYLKYLADARLINMLNKNASGINLLQKPEQIFPENSNMAYAASDKQPNVESLRRIFFLNQLKVIYPVTYPEESDFLIDDKYLFETIGKNKIPEQTSGNKNTFIAVDDIETGYENRIPLWLFGFLY